MERLTKKNINEFVKWTSSKYNSMRKKEFVNYAYDCLVMGGIPSHLPRGKYHRGEAIDGVKIANVSRYNDTHDIVYLEKTSIIEVGAYTPASHMTGADYLINPMESYIAKGRLDEDGNFIEEERETYYFA